MRTTLLLAVLTGVLDQAGIPEVAELTRLAAALCAVTLGGCHYPVYRGHSTSRAEEHPRPDSIPPPPNHRRSRGYNREWLDAVPS